MLKEITLNGIPHWYDITGHHPEKCLIVVHGGPGFAMMPLFHHHVPELENYFTVINYDQRGAGRSYHADIPKSSMTLTALVEDLHELITFLKSSFTQIYLLGHSTGTMLCTTLLQTYPDDVIYYIGVGQVVQVGLNEENTYNKVLATAQRLHHTKAIAELTAVGAPSKANLFQYRKESGYDVTEKWIDYFGYELFGKKNLDDLYIEMNESNVYADHLNELNSGYEFSQNLWHDSRMNGYEIPLTFPVPVLFLHGRMDYTTSIDLIQQYYPRITAPKKELVIFEKSAHFPFVEVPDQFCQALITRFV